MVSDLDSLLDDSELRSAKQRFWSRYRLRFPTEMYPSDATVSRVSRELTKRMLCVTSVWKVKALQWQLLTTNKKRKLRDGLFTEEPEAEEPCAHTSEAYLDRLMTLMVVYAPAGTAVVAGAPARAEEDQLGADATKFVEVPLDSSTMLALSGRLLGYIPPSVLGGSRRGTQRSELSGSAVTGSLPCLWVSLSKRHTRREAPTGFARRLVWK